jgi:hypothetical protein
MNFLNEDDILKRFDSYTYEIATLTNTAVCTAKLDNGYVIQGIHRSHGEQPFGEENSKFRALGDCVKQAQALFQFSELEKDFSEN